MKNKLCIMLNILLFYITSSSLNAQCNHNPSITSPRLNIIVSNSILLCNPSDSEILSTQIADSYQWYKKEWSVNNQNPWVIINGANSQTRIINGVDDYFYYYKVATTVNGCTAESPEILIDGFAYQLPTMLTTFEPNSFEQINDLEYNVCEGSTVIFDNISNDLWDNVTWYKCEPNTLPPSPSDLCVIQNQNGDTFTTTVSGNYGYYACTAYCPDQCEFLGTTGFIKLNFGSFIFCNLNNDDFKKSNSLNIYPNPVQQLLFIGKEEDGNYAKIRIYDSYGKLVLEKRNHKYSEPIDVSNLSTGTFVIISNTSKSEVYKNKFIKN